MTTPTFQTHICGDVTRGMTIAEIDFGEQPVASVFESPGGWHIEISPSETISFPLDGFVSAVAAAKERLSRYVNRRGENPPEGLSAAGFSLWLMENRDGTAMGVRLLLCGPADAHEPPPRASVSTGQVSRVLDSQPAQRFRRRSVIRCGKTARLDLRGGRRVIGVRAQDKKVNGASCKGHAFKEGRFPSADDER